MPTTPAPNKIRVTFSVPENLYEEAIAIAEDEGWSESDLHRIYWVLGSAAYAEVRAKRKTGRP